MAGMWVLFFGFIGTASASRVETDRNSVMPFRIFNAGRETGWDLNIVIDHRSHFRGAKPGDAPKKGFFRGLLRGRLVPKTVPGTPSHAKRETKSNEGPRGSKLGPVEIPVQLQKNGSAWSFEFEEDTPTARVAMTVSGRKGSPLVRLVAKFSYLRPTFVQQESLEIGFSCDDLYYINRAEEMNRVAPPGILHRVDRWTHKRVDVKDNKSQWSLIASTGLSGMSLEQIKPVKKRRARKGPAGKNSYPRCRIVLEYDDAQNHPAVYAARCKRRWYPPSPRLSRSRRFRRKGEVVVRESWFFFGDPPPVAHKARLPHGYAAAVSFTDHADQSAPGPLKALLLGRSDASFSKPAGGFIGNGLSFTKTLFHRGSARPQMQHSGVRKMVKQGSAAGIEFGPHSATPGPDDRKSTQSALKAFAPWGVTWIDHQPDTNCEAYSSRGWDAQSPFFIADLLYKHNFRYVWSGDDVSLPQNELNMLRPEKPGERASFFFPFHVSTLHEGKLWLFRSVWFYVGPEDFSRAFSAGNLKKLAENRGIFIAHTYLDSHHPPGHRRHRLALIRRHRKGTKGYWHLHPKAEESLSRLARAQRRNEIWTTSMRDLGNHLSCWNSVTLRPSKSNSLVITNPGRCALAGFTFRIKGNWKGKAFLLGSASASGLSADEGPAENRMGKEKTGRKWKKMISINTAYSEPWTTGVMDLPADSVVEVSISPTHENPAYTRTLQRRTKTPARTDGAK